LSLEKEFMRYKRNFKALSLDDQKKLASSTVAVVGCGGLGGYIAEQLARIGIGHLILIDGDRIEETNLNRQLFALEENIGSLKAEAAKERLQKVNSSVKVDIFSQWFTEQNGKSLIEGADLVCDALDSGKTRIELERVCNDLNIPLVLAAIGGWYGIVTVSYPGDFTAETFFGDSNKGIETELGNPVFTPATVASIAVTEAVKVLINRSVALRKNFLYIDLLTMEFNKFQL